MAVRTAANRARIIAWSRIRDDVGLTNQVCVLKIRSGIQKSRRAVRLPFQSTFKFRVIRRGVWSNKSHDCSHGEGVIYPTQDFHMAAEVYNSLLEILPQQQVELHSVIGRLYLQLGDLKSAQTYFSRVVKSCDNQEQEGERQSQHQAIIKINE